MQLLRTIHYIVIVLALVTSVVIASQTSGRGVWLFVCLPYVVLVSLLYAVVNKKFSKPSQIAFSIASMIVCITSTYSYYDATFQSTSSTAGLMFLMAPLTFLFVLLIFFLIIRSIVGLIWYPDHNNNAWRLILIIAGTIFIIRLLSSSSSSHRSTFRNRIQKAKSTSGNIIQAKEQVACIAWTAKLKPQIVAVYGGVLSIAFTIPEIIKTLQS